MCRFLVFFLLTFSLQAQNVTRNISGTVTDSTEPLEGALVTYNNAQALTNANGHFTIAVPQGNQTIKVRYIGFTEKLLPVSGNGSVDLGNITLETDEKSLQELVVTGQFSPQSTENSVYQVRVINQEQIRLRGATNIQNILNTELGMRFSNDLTLGTTDVELMGMAGQNVKILLDGVPLIDRGSTRESLGQIDINNVEKIEIVEGPMSVTYGSNALAGVINIITKKGTSKGNITVNARIQEETAGSDYKAFSGTGTHFQSLGVAWQRKIFNASAGYTRNNFGGWQGSLPGRKMEWMPKEQDMFYAQVGIRNVKHNTWYRFNGTDETLQSMGDSYTNVNTNSLFATDQFYVTKRWFHQLQSEYSINNRNSISLAASYTDYNRSTQTTDINLETKRRTQNLQSVGNQDKAMFKTSFARITGQHRIGSYVSLQEGLEITLDQASGERIDRKRDINDIAFFASAEIKPTDKISLRPGFRVIHNSVYDAPPLIPSLNTKFILGKGLDLRAAYARGFRSPALRELYFTFFDASHSIRGNQNLKAETSDSFNAFLTYQVVDKKSIRLNSTLGGFYNVFKNLITIGIDPADATINTYLNIDEYKTTGLTLNNTLYWKELHATLGYSRIGRYNRLTAADETLPDFMWANEVNSNIRYNFPKIASTVSLFIKYTGKLPRYVAVSTTTGTVPTLTEVEAFTLADLTFNKVFYKSLTLNIGVKNLFGVTRLANTNPDSGGAHSTGGSVPMSYGRSYFAGLSYQFTK